MGTDVRSTSYSIEGIPMTFWFCGSCRKTWHSYIITPDPVKTLRCFHCLETGAIRLKDDTLKERDATMTYDDYRWFRKNNGKFTKKNGLRRKKRAKPEQKH